MCTTFIVRQLRVSISWYQQERSRSRSNTLIPTSHIFVCTWRSCNWQAAEEGYLAMSKAMVEFSSECWLIIVEGRELMHLKTSRRCIDAFRAAPSIFRHLVSGCGCAFLVTRTPIGQGSNALLKGCVIPKTSVGRIVVPPCAPHLDAVATGGFFFSVSRVGRRTTLLSLLR